MLAMLALYRKCPHLSDVVLISVIFHALNLKIEQCAG